MPDPKARAALAAQTRAQRAYATGFRPGDAVRANCVGSDRFNGRSGRVVTTNLGEVGVSFGAADQTEAWFRPAELTRLR